MRKAALVTGAAGRLGRAMAIALAQDGHDVAVHFGSDRAGAEETAKAVTEAGREAVVLQADLTIEEDMQSLLPRASKALGAPVLTLVNNASIFEYDNIGSATRKSWDRHMESNLRAPFVLMQALAAQAPQAEEDANGEPRARALVVNMIDQRVLKPTPEFMTYSLAKMGLWALTRSGAQALAPHVRVNAIGPGPTLRGHRQTDIHFQRQRKATILERGANPDDVIAALRYFLNAPAVTGQMIAVDGGQHLAWKTPDVLGVE